MRAATPRCESTHRSSGAHRIDHTSAIAARRPASESATSARRRWKRPKSGSSASATGNTPGVGRASGPKTSNIGAYTTTKTAREKRVDEEAGEKRDRHDTRAAH